MTTLAEAPASWPLLAHSVFTAQESFEITKLFKEADQCHGWKILPFLDGEDDLWKSHANALAAVVNESGVPPMAVYSTCILPKQINEPALDWVLERVASAFAARLNRHPSDLFPSTAKSLRRRLEMILMHEFTTGQYFGWHMDTKRAPKGYGETGRAYAINVMLSEPEVNFLGGTLHVGGASLSVHQGDLYLYPSNLPHRVTPVTDGMRHTLVLQLNDPEPFYPSWEEYYNDAERRMADWIRPGGALAGAAGVHLLHAQVLSRQGRSEAQIDEAMCACYASETAASPMKLAEHLAASGQTQLARCVEDRVRPSTSLPKRKPRARKRKHRAPRDEL